MRIRATEQEYIHEGKRPVAASAGLQRDNVTIKNRHGLHSLSAATAKDRAAAPDGQNDSGRNSFQGCMVKC